MKESGVVKESGGSGGGDVLCFVQYHTVQNAEDSGCQESSEIKGIPSSGMVGGPTMMNEWLALLQTFGLAVTIILFMGICIWKGAGWLAENVLKPVVARYLKLLDSLIASVEKQGEVLVHVGDMITKLGETLDVIAQNVMEMRGVKVVDVPDCPLQEIGKKKGQSG